MTDKKRYKLEGFQLTDWKVMEEHYKNMASKGLLVEKFKWGISTYRKGYPEDMEYYIGIYPQPKAYETVDKEKTRKYVEQQKEKGWNHVCSKDHLHIFSSREGNNLETIDTSAQMDNIRRTIKLENISFISIILLNVFNLWNMFPIHPSIFYYNTGLFSLILMPTISIFLLVSVIRNIRIWLNIKGKDDIDEFPFMNPSAVLLSRKVQMTVSVLLITILIAIVTVDSVVAGNMIILTILPVIAGLFVAFKLRGFFGGRNMGTVQKTLVALVIVFVVIGLMTIINMRLISTGFGDQLPDDYKALRIENPDTTSFRREGSVIAPTRYSYREWRRNESVSTEVTGYINDSVAEYFYDMELESDTRFMGDYWDAKKWYPDYDRAQFITYIDQEMEDGGILFLKKDEYIVRLYTGKDFRKEEVVVNINEFVDSLFKEGI
ncbi:DUF2812 domain-containing protein [Gudongella sp. DL1XJH-153]|uniref:DUF2812 domain-containing protein n=1 Tax=Gudongella sp. DL1XJH-153 TaxID=3409804 RepID=UPI003BB5135A